MDLELLRTFLELHQSRHFGRTADALHITQAAVSQRLRALERHLGVRLFDRRTRALRLTPAGNRLVGHAERQIAAWRAARQDVGSRDAAEQLALGGSLRLWNAMLQPWLHDLRRAFPSLAIIAESMPPELLTRGLIDGTLDVAFMLEPAQLDVLEVRPVGVLELELVASTPGITVTEALGNHYVYVDWGLAHGLEHRRTFPDAPPALTRASQAKIALEYLRDVGGSAYLPRNMVESDLASARLFLVADAPVFHRTAHAAYLVRSTRRPFIESCIALIRASTNSSRAGGARD